jgi:hypothetical protein
MTFPKPAKSGEVEKSMLSGTHPSSNAWEDGDVENVAAGNRLNNGLGIAETVVVGDPSQPGKAVGSPERETDVEPDLVAILDTWRYVS